MWNTIRKIAVWFGTHVIKALLGKVALFLTIILIVLASLSVFGIYTPPWLKAGIKNLKEKTQETSKSAKKILESESESEKPKQKSNKKQK